jgi:predicted Zn-dependent protease
MRFFVLIAALLAGCAATAPPQTQSPSPSPPAPVETAPAPAPAAPLPPAASAPPRQNPAVMRLMASAQEDIAASRLGSAEATLERALRISPRDARLWQQLARIRLRQGQYQQAESLAARSNTWAGSDDALRAENWKLIAQARDALGDAAGARAAEQNAERYAQ